ncbi:MAG: hypothetical protein AAFO07_20525 [Bacteroidota bacterium]
MKYSTLFILLLIIAFSFSCSSKEQEKEKAPVVTAIYPSTDTLPENLLRMYIHFSQPMKTIGNLEQIKLLDDSGKEVQGAIFNNVYELWDNEQQQLTLIFDPSRVKTALKVNEELGRALQEGRHYQLVIDSLKDVYGIPLSAPFRKSFWVGPEDVIPPDHITWEIATPPLNTRSPLTIHFPDMLDLFSLQQRLILTHQNNQAIDGNIEIGPYEKTWQLIPARPWQSGNYTLYIHTRLEDPAGNNLNGLFDHKKGELKYATEDVVLQLPILIE